MNDSWRNYEDSAVYVIGEIRRHLGISEVESKQTLEGESGTHWEVDAKAVLEDGGILVIECKCHGRRLNQDVVINLVGRVRDTGAQGGILVSPFQLQKGARKVADHYKVISLQLDPRSSEATGYVARVFENTFIGLKSTIPPPTVNMKSST